MAKVFIEESNLTAIGDAIRAKTGKSELLNPTAMPEEIEAIQTGGGEIEPIVLTGDCQYACANPAWNQLFPMVSTKDITGASNMFYMNEGVEEIPFDFNFDNSSSSGIKLEGMFNGANNLKAIKGKFKPVKVRSINSIFANCNNLRELPEFEDLDLSILQTVKTNGSQSLFQGCNSLRSIPEDFLKKLYNPLATSYMYTPLYRSFMSCYVLDEIRGLNPQTGKLTSNAFQYTFNDCSRVKNIIFATQEDGTPYSVSWNSQTIDLTQRVGYVTSAYDITSYNSGITNDKCVYDADTYAALKDDPDWWTTSWNYSRYNHDSAVNTINSLPDASSGSGNTIKFTQQNGTYTDGGAIGNLTEEEIAVATAKGWTVSLVSLL